MFGALFKAFTGRAGLLAGLLAMLITAVIVYVSATAPSRIEQKLVGDAQALIQAYMGSADSLDGLRADGRDLSFSGQFQDVESLKAKLTELEGVRHIDFNHSELLSAKTIVNGSANGSNSSVGAGAASSAEAVEVAQGVQIQADPVQSDMAISNEAAATEVPNGTVEPQAVEMITNTDQELADQKLADQVSADQVSADQVLAPVDQPEAEVSAGADVEGSDAGDSAGAKQSSLALRYDGLKLSLSGHMADDQMAQLISDEVRAAMPQDSDFESTVDGQGMRSSLNWMNQFLDAVVMLPSDAQGVINGSDIDGVQILPDTEQTLIQSPQAAPEAMQAEIAQAPELQVAGTVETEAAGVSAGVDTNTAENTTGVVSSDATVSAPITEPAQVSTTPSDQAAAVVPEQGERSGVIVDDNPAEYILNLNKRVAQQPMFEPGEIELSDVLSDELDQLANMMQNHPSLFLRIVGNLDFSVDSREAEYVGVDRSRKIRDYLRLQGVEPYRVFSAPLPREHAFDKQIQVVFYISE